MQVVLDETAEVVRAERGVLICRTRHGFVCANAGVDASNAPARRHARPACRATPTRPPARCAPRCPAGPRSSSPTRSAARGATARPTSRSAIAGLAPLEDWRGRADSAGRELRATWIAVADEAAAAADLVRDKDSREPAVVVRGLERHVTDEDGPGAAALVRPRRRTCSGSRTTRRGAEV